MYVYILPADALVKREGDCGPRLGYARINEISSGLVMGECCENWCIKMCGVAILLLHES